MKTQAFAKVRLEDTAIGKEGVAPGHLPQLAKEATTAQESIGLVFERFANYLFMFAGAVAIYFIIDAGFKLISARGEEEKVQKGHQQLLWAILGFLLVIVSYAIVVNISQFVFQALKG
jgi:hypothetical protein